jgi:hypothetical protein
MEYATMSEKHSVPSNAFNSRVVPEAPKPVQPQREGPPAPTTPTYAGYKRHASDLTPSEAPVLDLPSASKIAAGVEAALNKHDAAQARANGDETFEQRRLLGEIGRRVKSGEISNEHGRIWWETMYPGVDPSTVGGQK